ncbi:MAG: helix-turn-helix domain-containing protein [Acidobacteriota bacterium]
MKHPAAQILRRLRRQSGYSLQEVGHRLGVHFTTVSSWERGRSEPPLKTLEVLARLYGVPLSDLLGRARYPEPVDPFRALAGPDAESLIKKLEEIRLLGSLAHELDRPESGAEMARRTGIPLPRLQALGKGEAQLRPLEIAALVRELRAAGSTHLVETRDPGDMPAESTLPRALSAQAERLLLCLRRYLEGDRPG